MPLTLEVGITYLGFSTQILVPAIFSSAFGVCFIKLLAIGPRSEYFHASRQIGSSWSVKSIQ